MGDHAGAPVRSGRYVQPMNNLIQFVPLVQPCRLPTMNPTRLRHCEATRPERLGGRRKPNRKPTGALARRGTRFSKIISTGLDCASASSYAVSNSNVFCRRCCGSKVAA